MEKQRIATYIVLITVLGLAIGLCAFTTKGQLDLSLPVALELPSELPGFEALDILHCQNGQCMASHMVSNLEDKSKCPECGSNLDPISLAEKELLPADTEIIHKTYRGKNGENYQVSVVVSGYNRRSIHKPQVCLVAQGHHITKQYPAIVKLDKDRSLDITIMELDSSKNFYAYWFTNGEIETASHLNRLFYTAWDGIIHNRRRRWAYISIYSSINNRQQFIAKLNDFVTQLYPSLIK